MAKPGRNYPTRSGYQFDYTGQTPGVWKPTNQEYWNDRGGLDRREHVARDPLGQDEIMSFQEWRKLSANEKLQAINSGEVPHEIAMGYERGDKAYETPGNFTFVPYTEPSDPLPNLVFDSGKWYPEDQILPDAYDTDVGSRDTFSKRFPGIGPNENPYAYMKRMDEARLKQQGEPFIGDRGAAPPAGQGAPGSMPAEDMIRSQAPQQRQPDFSKISPLPEGEAADFSVTEDDRRRSTAQAFNDPSLWVPDGMMRMPGRETLVRPGDWKDTRMPGPNVGYNHPANTVSPEVEAYVKDPEVDQRRLGTYSSGGQVDPNKPAAGPSPFAGPGSPADIRAGVAFAGTPESERRAAQDVKRDATGQSSTHAPILPEKKIDQGSGPGVVEKIGYARSAAGTNRPIPTHVSGHVIDESSPHFGATYDVRTHRYDPETKRVMQRETPVELPENIESVLVDTDAPMHKPFMPPEERWPAPQAEAPAVQDPTRPPIANPKPPAPIDPRDMGNIPPIAPIGQPPQPPQPPAPLNEFNEQEVGMNQVPDDGQPWEIERGFRNRTKWDDVRDQNVGWGNILDAEQRKLKKQKTGETEDSYLPPWTQGADKRSGYSPSEWKHSTHSEKRGYLLNENVDQIFGAGTSDRVASLDYNDFTSWMNVDAPKFLEETYGPSWREILAEQLGQGYDGIPFDERPPLMEGPIIPGLPNNKQPGFQDSSAALNQGNVNFSAEAAEQYGLPTMRIADVVNADNPLMSDATLLNRFRQRAQRNRA